ncbi:hypothetical protein M408DRAFT_293465 [Serendipita vermifera MAFF 305830]|uniref:Uncharacterized protein n=1 Tax=Serendipita vermifera MAFF 305830 TaxID=933852 RepID=A0A0C3APZ9_SERVB|nr:hypothetical protein M408DRAFT_293465 [Serendipita vermifera MAFF 305830]
MELSSCFGTAPPSPLLRRMRAVLLGPISTVSSFRYPTAPMKLANSALFVGVGHFIIELTLCGSILIPSSVMRCPSTSSSLARNCIFFGFRNSFCSRRISNTVRKRPSTLQYTVQKCGSSSSDMSLGRYSRPVATQDSPWFHLAS